MRKWWYLPFAACILATPALARESCSFVRDPAFWARTPVAAAEDGELTIATQNLFRLFDAEQDRNEKAPITAAQFSKRIDRIARYIAGDLGAPALIALQEIEDETSMLALTQALRRETGREYRHVLGEVSGDGDTRGALLLDARLKVVSTFSLFARTPRAGKPLHDRLPLVVDVDAGKQGRLLIVVVHMKSLIGLDSKRDEERKRVSDKRLFQARELAAWARKQIAAGKRVVVLGDFNATVLDTNAGRSDPMRVLLADSGLIDVAGKFLQPSQRWTYRYHCQLNELDHALVSPALAPDVVDYDISRGDTCIRVKEKCKPEHSVSDHDGVVLRLH